MDQTEARKLAVELMQETPDRIWVAVTAAHWRGEFESGEPRWGVSNGSRFYDHDPRQQAR